VRPVSVCALGAVSCLLVLPTMEAASAAPGFGSRGSGAHSRPFVVHRPAARNRSGHHGLRRHVRFHHFHRFRGHHGFAGGWPGYVDGVYAPFAPAVFDEPVREREALPSGPHVPLVVGIREAPAARPAIYIIGHKERRLRGSRGGAEPESGPQVIHVTPGR